MIKKNDHQYEPLEKNLWKVASKFRKIVDVAEYKNVVLGFTFLKYIPDIYNELPKNMVNGEGEYSRANPEGLSEFEAEITFFALENARWAFIQSSTKVPKIGKFIDDTMDAIELENRTARQLKWLQTIRTSNMARHQNAMAVLPLHTKN